jgi:hypothetical protein
VGWCHPFFFILLCLVDLLCGGRYSFPVTIRFLARRSFLESLVLISYVASRLLMRLTPGNDMIPDAGIMVCPVG